MGHLQVDIILPLQPESFGFFVSYSNLQIPARLNNKSPDLHKKAKPWKILVRYSLSDTRSKLTSSHT